MKISYPKSKRNRHTGVNNAMVDEILAKGDEFVGACGKTYKRFRRPIKNKEGQVVGYQPSPIVKVKGAV